MTASVRTNHTAAMTLTRNLHDVFPDELLFVVADFADNPVLARASRRLWMALRWRIVRCVTRPGVLCRPDCRPREGEGVHQRMAAWCRLATVGACIHSLRLCCTTSVDPAEVCAALDRCCHVRILRVHLRPGQTHPQLLDYLASSLLRGMGSAVGGLSYLGVHAVGASLTSIHPIAALLLWPAAHTRLRTLVVDLSANPITLNAAAPLVAAALGRPALRHVRLGLARLPASDPIATQSGGPLVSDRTTVARMSFSPHDNRPVLIFAAAVRRCTRTALGGHSLVSLSVNLAHTALPSGAARPPSDDWLPRAKFFLIRSCTLVFSKPRPPLFGRQPGCGSCASRTAPWRRHR